MPMIQTEKKNVPDQNIYREFLIMAVINASAQIKVTFSVLI